MKLLIEKLVAFLIGKFETLKKQLLIAFIIFLGFLWLFTQLSTIFPLFTISLILVSALYLCKDSITYEIYYYFQLNNFVLVEQTKQDEKHDGFILVE